MAVALSRFIGRARGPYRRVAWILLVIGVLGVHGCVTQSVADRIAEIRAEQAMPVRMQVVYVRVMEISEPPPTAAPAAPPPDAVTQVPRARRMKPARPASAPGQARPEPAEPVLAAASAPGPAIEPVPESARNGDSESPAMVPAAPAMPVESATAVQASAEANAAPAPASSAPAAFEWPASTRLSYLLTGNYRGEVNGSAQVEWVRAGSHYQVHLDLVVGPSAAPLITRRMTSDGEITAEGLAPRRYDQDTKVVLRERNRVTIVFEPGAVVLANGERRDSVAGVQDTASQFVQLTYVFSTRPELLRVGGSVDIPVALPHKVDVWTYDMVAEEVLDTPFGPLPSMHLKPRRAASRPGELSAETWFAPQLRYLPARIRIQQDPQTYIDLMISQRPEIAGQ